MSDRLAFLHALLPAIDGPVSYYVGVNRPPEAGVGKGAWAQAECTTIEKVASVLDEAAGVAEVYVALAAFAPGQGRKKAAILAKSWISADVDAKAMPGDTPEERRENARRLVATIPVPVVVVDSGGGFHPHVRLPDGHRVEDFEDPAVGVAHVEALGAALRRYLEAKGQDLFAVRVELDHTDTPERVWRAPPGVNCKAEDGQKLLTADRDAWRPVRLVGRPEGVADTPVADLEFLARFMERAAPRPDEAAPDTPPGPPTGFDPTLLPEDLRGHWPMAEGNQSAHDFAVCKALAEAGHGPEVLADAIAARRSHLPDPGDRAKGRRPDYVFRTIANAQHAAVVSRHTPHTPLGARDTKEAGVRLVSAAAYVAKVTAVIEWIWERVIPKGATVIVSGLPKAGKTTLLFHLVRVLVCVTRALGGSGGVCDTREFLGRAVRPARVAWLALEEPPPLFRARLVELGLADAADLLVLDPESGIPSIEQLAALEAAITEGRIDILFADPLIDFLQVADENDATEMARAFRKLRAAIRRTGCTVALIHHDHKGEGQGIALVRGSTAITGAADVIVQVSAPFGETDPRRHIEIRGRYGLDAFDAILEADGYRLLAPEDVARRRENEREAKKRATRAAKERARAEAVERAVAYLLAHPEGVTRGGAIAALGLPVNEAKAILDLAVLKLGGRAEKGVGSKPTRWFAPAERGGGGDA